MVGFEILVNVHRDKRQEFLQTCDLLAASNKKSPSCLRQALFENAIESNQFLWVEHWKDRQEMDQYLKSDRFGILLGAIAVLGDDTDEIKRMEMITIDFGGQMERGVL